MANLLVPTTYADIATAIGAANNGDSINLEESGSPFQGANNRNLDSGGLDPITFRGLGADPSDVVIDCQNAGRAFTWSTNENDITIENFTIINGNGNGGQGGALSMQSVEVTANHIVIYDCVGTNRGGAIFSGYAGGKLDMFNCLVFDNTCNFGARAHGGGIICYHTINTIKNCTIAYNTAATGAGLGGGVMLWGDGASVAITDSIIWGNVAAGGGNQIWRNNSHVNSGSLNYCDYSNGVGDVAGTWTITNSIVTDPLFATGDDGDYYLSQIAAGQGADSGAVDSGSDAAANLGLDTYTTRTDNVYDDGTADMGFHYLEGQLAPDGYGMLQMVP